LLIIVNCLAAKSTILASGWVVKSSKAKNGFVVKPTKNAELRADLIKWMFIFWSTTIITMVASYLLK
jgi:hypothetical protein